MDASKEAQLPAGGWVGHHVTANTLLRNKPGTVQALTSITTCVYVCWPLKSTIRWAGNGAQLVACLPQAQSPGSGTDKSGVVTHICNPST